MLQHRFTQKTQMDCDNINATLIESEDQYFWFNPERKPYCNTLYNSSSLKLLIVVDGCYKPVLITPLPETSMLEIAAEPPLK